MRSDSSTLSSSSTKFQMNSTADLCWSKSWLLWFSKSKMSVKINTNIALYSSCENRYSIDAKSMVDQRFAIENIKVVVGQQSLFYLLGKMSKEMASVRWISKERLFFSQSFLQTKEIVEDEFQWKVYSLFQFGDAIKQKIIEIFYINIKYMNELYQYSVNIFNNNILMFFEIERDWLFLFIIKIW